MPSSAWMVDAAANSNAAGSSTTERKLRVNIARLSVSADRKWDVNSDIRALANAHDIRGLDRGPEPLFIGPCSLVLGHHQHFHSACRILASEDLFCCLLEVFRFGVWNVGKRLRIAIGKREPRTLHLHHDAVPATERVKQVRHREVHLSLLAGRERFGLLPAVSKLGAEWLTTQQLLIAAPC